MCRYLQQVQQGHRLQHCLEVFQQGLLRDSRPGHDVAHDALQHALAHRAVDVAVHQAPRAADETDVLAVR